MDLKVNDIELGDRVQDNITQLIGIATGLCVYVNGCIQILITPKRKKDGELVKGDWIDIASVEVLEKNPLNLNLSVEFSGGPQNAPII